MKSRLLTFALILNLALPTAARLRAEEKPAHKEPETELGKTMEGLNGAWRKVRAQAADPAKNASSVELLGTITAAAEKALTLKPAKVEDLPAADREKFVQDYQKQMKAFLAQLGQLQAAFKANDNAAATALIEKIGALRKESHKEFKRPDM
jgi:soluble cytochrome b562